MPGRDTLYEQIALRLRARCFLFDVERIYELVAGRTDAIDRAIDHALRSERAALQRGERPTDAERDRYRFWTDVFQLELADARRAGVTFNSLDEHTRQIFFALIIEERPVQKECVDAGLGNRDELGRVVRLVFETLMDARAEHTRRYAPLRIQ